MGNWISHHYKDGIRPSEKDSYVDFFVNKEFFATGDIEVINKIRVVIYEPYFSSIWKEFCIISENYEILDMRIFLKG